MGQPVVTLADATIRAEGALMQVASGRARHLQQAPGLKTKCMP